MDAQLYRQMACIQQDHWWFAARRQILRRVIAARMQPIPAEILEIGCGTGGNLAMLSDFGSVYAVEMDDYALGIAQNTAPQATLRSGWLPEAIPFAERQFDLVCLFDVLEHVEDDRAALAAIFTRVRPGGQVLLTVPAYQLLYGGHDIAHHHFRRYRVGVLRDLAQAAGFRVCRKGYFNTLLFPLIALARLAERLTGRQSHGDTALPPARLNRLLYRLFASEARVLSWSFFPFGVSAIMILERPVA